MKLSIRRRSTGLLLGAVALLVTALFAIPGTAGASTIYACKAKNGNIRLVGKKTKCKKGQKKIKWNVQGSAGKNGSNGSNGSNGAAGQPQKMIKFSASQANAFSPAAIALFSADGVNFTFDCQSVLFFDVGELKAGGAAGQAYGLGNFERPAGITALTNDLKTDLIQTSIGGAAKAVAITSSAATSDSSIEQLGVWTVTVEGPTSTIWIHASFDTNPTCAIRGSAIVVPN